MQDLELQFLPARIVSGLTGLSPRALRRLSTAGIPPRPRRGPRRPSAGRRLYSWREVEQLQQATYLIQTRRLPLLAVKEFLARGRAAFPQRAWVIARPNPRMRRRSVPGGGAGRSAPPRMMRYTD